MHARQILPLIYTLFRGLRLRKGDGAHSLGAQPTLGDVSVAALARQFAARAVIDK